MKNNIARSGSSNNNSSSSVISDYSITKESFICNECGTDFLNRDTLAMHVMENVRDGKCHNGIGTFVEESSAGPFADVRDGGNKSRSTYDQNACVTPDSVFVDRIAKKTRDALRSSNSCFSPPLTGCAQNLLKTIINPLTLPAWFRIQQESSQLESTGTTPVKFSPWCSDACPYTGEMLIPSHRPGKICSESPNQPDSIRRRLFDRRDLHANFCELRKRRVEKWKEAVSHDRPVVNWLAYKTLTMLNDGQSHSKMRDAVGQMLSVIDYSKLGRDPPRIPVHLGESCSVTSSNNKPEAPNSDHTRLGGMRLPTPTRKSKCSAMSCSRAADSVADLKVPEYSEPTKVENSTACDTTDAVLCEAHVFSHVRSRSTPPELGSQSKEFNSATRFRKQDWAKNRHRKIHSEMKQDSGRSSSVGMKVGNISNRKTWTGAPLFLHTRPLPRKPRMGRPLLGKRIIQRTKRLRRTVQAFQKFSFRTHSPNSCADSTSCRTSVSSSNCPASPLTSTDKRIRSDHSGNVGNNSEYNSSISGSDLAFKGGVEPFYCSHCQIGFKQKTLFSLHMGLHCVDQPWKCNMCGQYCSGVYEFTAHTLHF